MNFIKKQLVASKPFKKFSQKTHWQCNVFDETKRKSSMVCSIYGETKQEVESASALFVNAWAIIEATKDSDNA